MVKTIFRSSRGNNLSITLTIGNGNGYYLIRTCISSTGNSWGVVAGIIRSIDSNGRGSSINRTRVGSGNSLAIVSGGSLSRIITIC